MCEALRLGLMTLALIACDRSAAQQQDSTAPAQAVSAGDAASFPKSWRDRYALPSYAPAVLRAVPPADSSVEAAAIDSAATAAWAYIERNYIPATGLVAATPTWPYPTVWDIGSTLLAFYAGHELGFLGDSAYADRVSRLLKTMTDARLYHGFTFGRSYDARTGALVRDDGRPDNVGSGYSSVDLGRLLIALATVATNDTQFASAAKSVARRVDAARVLKGGYLTGNLVNSRTGRYDEYLEGRLGYEQYSAEGFALWGMPATQAMNPALNGYPATVYDIPVTADKRGNDRLTSEPFILHGLELGWNAAVQELALQTLSAQARRYEKTGTVTIASEDAIDYPPYFFYYFCVYCNRKPFVVSTTNPAVTLNGPHWLSTKAAFAWYALMPRKYTWLGIEHVRPALDDKLGWASGVYEKTQRSTRSYDVNTAAVILEAALYRRSGQPLLRRP